MDTTVEFRAFLQAQVNRRCVGALRYSDKPNARQKYMKRLDLEWKAYKKTGNIEHLANVAVYAFLESAAPQHPKSHWDPTVESATRGKV